MLTRDGVRLDADVYYPPDLSCEYPVLLMRQPYGRAIASTVVYAHPSWYAAQGYIVVIQDVRGRGTSEGEFKLFESGIEDGDDTVGWAANLPHSNGNVGMYGFSYQGMTQVYAAVNQPEALKAIAPAMLAYDLYDDWAYEGGVFCLQANLGWALQLEAETARLKQDRSAFLALSQAAKQLPITGAIPAYPDLLKNLAPDSFYHDWLTRDRGDQYWQKLSPKTYLNSIAPLPMLHIGGWFDPYLRGTLNLYQAMYNCHQAPQQLILGPWAHLPWGRRAGAIDFGAQAVSDCDRSQVRWFDYWLKGKGALDPAATWFEMGTNRWVTGEDGRGLATGSLDSNAGGDSVGRQVWQLETTGLTSMRDGRLVAIERPDPPKFPYPSGSLTPKGRGTLNVDFTTGSSSPTLAPPFTRGAGGDRDVIVHDPWRPVPSLGGHAASPAGMFDRANLDDRSDVLTYTTKLLDSAFLIHGLPAIQLEFQTFAVSVDLNVVLSQVLPDGTVLAISQGVTHIRDAINSQSCTINLQAISLQIPAGNRLRVSVSLSHYPAYAMNAGTGNPLHEEQAIDYQIITLYLEGGVLRLPIGDATIGDSK